MAATVVLDALYEDALDVGHFIIVVGELVTVTVEINGCKNRLGVSSWKSEGTFQS